MMRVMKPIAIVDEKVSKVGIARIVDLVKNALLVP